MFRERLSSSRGNNRYGGVRQEKNLRNTNYTVMLYLILQELVPKAEWNLLVFLVMPILMCVQFFIFINCNCS